MKEKNHEKKQKEPKNVLPALRSCNDSIEQQTGRFRKEQL